MVASGLVRQGHHRGQLLVAVASSRGDRRGVQRILPARSAGGGDPCREGARDPGRRAIPARRVGQASCANSPSRVAEEEAAGRQQRQRGARERPPGSDVVERRDRGRPCAGIQRVAVRGRFGGGELGVQGGAANLARAHDARAARAAAARVPRVPHPRGGRGDDPRGGGRPCEGAGVAAARGAPARAAQHVARTPEGAQRAPHAGPQPHGRRDAHAGIRSRGRGAPGGGWRRRGGGGPSRRGIL
mmetsp:Transcript_39812/g.94557  ORF Transcript_39812/g.94557 Transcript_39812/m.94557 type:complete len:244 (-) Transcript_39812:365-1096(-)